MAVLNSNPEVLLRKRKNADRKRVEKQDALRLKKESQIKKKSVPTDKFIRAEKLVMRNRATMIENKRVDNVLKYEQKQMRLLASKDEEPKLVFIIRIPTQNKAVRMPEKALAVLQVLRLTEENMGVFVKVTPTVVPVLKLIAPYIVVGKPSLASVRQLFQKRACVPQNEEVTKLDNNQLVEDHFEELGFICVEDLVHEVVSLGEGFKAVTQWVEPFKLTAPINGWGPLAKLARLQYANELKRKTTLAGHVTLEEIDIDKFIAEQN